MFFLSDPRCFGPLCKFQHNVETSIKTARVSRLSVSCDYVFSKYLKYVIFLENVQPNLHYIIPKEIWGYFQQNFCYKVIKLCLLTFIVGVDLRQQLPDSIKQHNLLSNKKLLFFIHIYIKYLSK